MLPKFRRGLGALVACVALMLVTFVACGGASGTNPATGGGDSGTGNATDATTGGDSSSVPIFGNDAGSSTPTALAVMPASASITVTALSGPYGTQAFTAKATYANGTTATASATWSVDRVDIATVDPNAGVVTPSGGTFGVVTLTATLGKLTATAKVTVALDATIEDAGLTSTQEMTLSGATTIDPTVASFAYPYDQTVFPRGLLPPELMWNGGAAGDKYLVHLTGPSFDLSIYTAADPPSGFAIPQVAWNALTTSAAGSTASCVLHRLSGGVAYASASESWTIADADLAGTIYYWEITEGELVQIDLASGTRSPVFDAGPSASVDSPTPLNYVGDGGAPWEDNGSGARCVACHSVSKDGSKLAGVFSRAAPGSTGPLGFYDFATASVQTIGDFAQNGIYDALTPDGKYAVVNTSTETMQLLDTTSGAPVASALDGIANLCDPTFSPDGTLFALSAGCSGGGNYPVEFNSANLGIYSFSETTAPFFTSPGTLLQSAGAGDAIAFPAFSPDSKFLFYQRGDYSRAKYGTNQHGVDDLYVVPATAGATQIALDKANGAGVLPPDSMHLNYAPTVNPIASGGYVWIVFTSPRDYGNVMVSPEGAPPNDATYANHKQLWVTAVDANIGTADPSHPAFWLPGQNAATANFFGYWALAPCKPTPTDGGTPPSCAAGFECCTGFCRDMGAGPVCTTEPTGCHQEGEACTSTADCCSTTSALQCIGGICQLSSPK